MLLTEFNRAESLQTKLGAVAAISRPFSFLFVADGTHESLRGSAFRGCVACRIIALYRQGSGSPRVAIFVGSVGSDTCIVEVEVRRLLSGTRPLES